MNYRHAFHAGGFADVIKHIVLVRILLYLQEKPAAFRVIDTHAGAGRLRSRRRRGAAQRRMADRDRADHAGALFRTDALALIKPYLDIVRAFNPTPATLKAYPGSPLIARALLRPQDRLTACEVEPTARKQLIDALRRDAQARVVDLDGWTALPAFVPPNERRGLVLIDPPFEAKDEFERLARRLRRRLRQMADRQLPAVVSGQEPARHRRRWRSASRATAASAKPPGKCLRLEFSVAPQAAGAALASTGLLIVNPPWTLQGELKTILPELEKPLGQGGAGRFRLEVPKP